MSAVQLAKGQNAPLSASQVAVTVQVGAAADLSALLLTSSVASRRAVDSPGSSRCVWANCRPRSRRCVW